MRPCGFALVSVLTVLGPFVAQAADADVKVSSIGYLPSRVKRASVTTGGTQFTLVREADGSAAMSGTLAAAKTDPDTSQSIAIADFSQVTESGSYYVDVPGVGRSEQQ